MYPAGELAVLRQLLYFMYVPQCVSQSIQVAEWLALPTLDYEILGSNPAGSGIQFMTVWCITTQNLSLSPIHPFDVERDIKHHIIIVIIVHFSQL